MLDPVTILTALAYAIAKNSGTDPKTNLGAGVETLSQMFGGALGNSFYGDVKKLREAFLRSAKPDSNQDLDRATTRSALHASLFCIMEALGEPMEPPAGTVEHWRQFVAERLPQRLRDLRRPFEGFFVGLDHAQLLAAKQDCEEQLRRIERKFTRSAIDPHRLLISLEDDYAQKRAAEALAAIEKEHGSLSEPSRGVFLRNWFGYLCGSFHYEIKSNQPVAHILSAISTAQLREEVRTGFGETKQLLVAEHEKTRTAAGLIKEDTSAIRQGQTTLALKLDELGSRLSAAKHPIPQRAPLIPASRTALPDPKALPSRYRMPYRSLGNGFVGRTGAVWGIHDSLSLGGAAVIEGVGAVTGAGGIGKSQLAVEYAHRFATSYSGGIFWIDAAQGKSTLVKQLIEGSEADFHTLERLNETDRLTRLWKVIGSYGSVLVILDDFPKNEALRSWLPPSTNIHTLITTRRRDLLVTSVPLDFLTKEDSLALLNTSHRQFGSEAEELVRRLGGLPLALELAKSYLNLRPDIPVDALLAEISRVGEMQALSQFSRDYADELPTGHEKEVAATFQISWDLVSQTSQDVLRIMSLVESVPVPRDLLRAMLAMDQNESIFNTRLGEAITELNRISLVDLDKDGDPTMHSLIGAFVKCNIQDQDPLRKQLPVSLKRLISDAGEDELRLKKIVPHAEFAFRDLASDNNGQATSRDEAIGLTVPLVTSALRLNTPASFERARSSCTATIGFLESLRKKASSDWTARLQTTLAGAYLNRGNTYSGSQETKFAEDDYSRTIELCEECKELFGYSAKVAVVKSIGYANRAQIYLENHSLSRGIADVESLLEGERITKERLGSEWPISDHSQLARSLGNLGADLANQTNAALAFSVQLLLASIVERTAEPDWASLNALGVLYLRNQEWRQAEDAFQKCEEAAIKSKSNEGQLKSRNNLGISLRKQGRLDEAERVCLDGVELASSVGELAWECQCLETLANVLMDQGHRVREARARKRIREIRKMIGDQADENLVDV